MPHKNYGKMHNDVPVTVSTTTRDLDWAAGFLEGEGTFAKNGYLAAVQVNPEPVERLQVLFGGHIRRVDPDKPHCHVFWRWWVTGTRGRGVMMTLYTLLSTVRQAQIEEALRLSC